MSPNDLAAIVPELVLVLAGGLLVLADAFAPRLRPGFGLLAAASAGVALALRWILGAPGAVFGGVLAVDALARFVDSYILAAVVLVALVSVPYLERTRAAFGEYYALLLWSAVGAMVLAKADHLLVVFIGLELLSIALYVLNAFHRDTLVSLESGFKYLVVGAFASALLLFGIALTYGGTGTLSLAAVALSVTTAANGNALAIAGLAFIVAGIGFKLALVPFHAWAPDVYQGAPTPVTAFLSVAPKGAVLVVLMRTVVAFTPTILAPHWLPLLATLAVASQTLGNLVAIAQRDIKRMLAYSGIAHMGYALVGVIAFGHDGAAAVLVYLAAYTCMNIAAFAVVSAFSESESEQHLITDLAGQGWERPFLSLALALAMFSLAGLPPTVGFVAKFLVFRAAVNEHLAWLAVVGVLNSLVSVFFYVRVVYFLYMKPVPQRAPQFSEPLWTKVVAGACAVAILLLGVLPGTLMAAAELAVKALVR